MASGLNPLAENRKSKVPAFREAVDKFLDAQRLATWRNEKHRSQWQATLGPAYCKPILDM